MVDRHAKSHRNSLQRGTRKKITLWSRGRSHIKEMKSHPLTPNALPFPGPTPHITERAQRSGNASVGELLLHRVGDGGTLKGSTFLS